jgi:membrane protein
MRRILDNSRTFLTLFRRATVKWFEDDAPRHGAAIAYYTLFALAPLLVIVVAVAGLVFGEAAVRGQIVQEVSRVIGEDGARAVQGILRRASEPREGITASVLAGVGFLMATTAAFLQMQGALNKIWKVKTTGGGFSVKRIIVRRLRAFSIVIAIGFLLMVSLAVDAAVSALNSWLAGYAPAWPTLLFVINQAVSVGVATLMFAVLYRVLPDVELEWRHVWVGAFTTAVLFAIGQRLVGLYLGHSAVASPFGAAGTIAIILVWVYYSSMIVLLGAQFTYQYFTRHRAQPRPMPGAVPDTAGAT